LLECSAGYCLPVVILHYSTEGAGRLTDHYIAQANIIIRTWNSSTDPDHQAKAKEWKDRMWAATVAAETVPYTPDGRQAMAIL
jgi:hypothetical protein